MMNSIMNDTAVSSAAGQLTLITQQAQQQQQQSNLLAAAGAAGVVTGNNMIAGMTTTPSAINHIQLPQQQQHNNNLQNHTNNNNSNTMILTNNSTNHRLPVSHQQPQQQHHVPQPVPPVVVLSKQRLHELVQEIDPSEQLDDEVEDALLHMADDFIDATVTAACQMARHRDSRTLEVRDVQLVLEKEWNISIPGYGHPLSQLNRFKSHSATTEAHKQRMALIKKTLKKM